ncbi:MAG: hypothetical protein WC564_01435 [Patescibacteria group bacterium]
MNYYQIKTKYSKKIKKINPNWDLAFLSSTNSLNLKYLDGYFKEMQKDFSFKGELPSLKAFKANLNRNYKGLDKESWIFVINNRQPIACLNYDLIAINKKLYCGLIIFIDVHRGYREHGLGHLLLRLLSEMIKSEVENRNADLLGYFAEVNDPKKMSPKELKADFKRSGIKTTERLLFWSKLGFKKLDFNYIQPSLGFGSVKYLSLIFKGSGLVKSLESPIIIRYLKEFTAFTISNKREAARDEDLKTMAKELRSKGEIKLIKI